MIAVCERPSRGRYVQGCRCAACTQANNDYWHKREKDKAKEAWGVKQPYWMDAEPVRSHLAYLLKHGFTQRGIARDYGISRTTMRELLVAHHRTGKPIKKIRTETGQKILDVGSHTSFVYYVKDRPIDVFDTLEDFCSKTGRSLSNAQWLCTPSARKKKTYLVRVIY